MKATRHLVLLVSCVLVSGGCTSPDGSHIGGTGNAQVAGGSVAHSDGFSISGGHLALEEGGPGFLFGRVREPGGDWEYTYFVILRHPSVPVGPGDRSNAVVATGGTRGTDREEMRFGKVKLVLEASVDMETAGTSLRIGTRDFDPSAGRVFLADVTKDPPVVKQLEAPLPQPAAAEITADNVKAIANEIARGLADRHPQIANFNK